MRKLDIYHLRRRVVTEALIDVLRGSHHGLLCADTAAVKSCKLIASRVLQGMNIEFTVIGNQIELDPPNYGILSFIVPTFKGNTAHMIIDEVSP